MQILFSIFHSEFQIFFQFKFRQYGDFRRGGRNKCPLLNCTFFGTLYIDGKSEIELFSEHIEISRKFKEEVVQPILKVITNQNQPSEIQLKVENS